MLHVLHKRLRAPCDCSGGKGGGPGSDLQPGPSAFILSDMGATRGASRVLSRFRSSQAPWALKRPRQRVWRAEGGTWIHQAPKSGTGLRGHKLVGSADPPLPPSLSGVTPAILVPGLTPCWLPLPPTCFPVMIPQPLGLSGSSPGVN